VNYLNRADNALQESEARLRQILDNTTAVIYAKDRDGRFLFVNQHFLRVFRLREVDVVGKLEQKVFSKAIADAHLHNDLQVWENNSPIEFEESALLEDGEHTYISLKFPLCHRDGKIYAVCGISTDITERKRAAEKLRESEERYRLLFEMESDAIVMANAETLQHMDVNRAALDLYGYSREEFLTLKSTDVSAEPERTQAAMHNFTGTVKVPLRYHRKKDGTVFPVEITANFFDMHGRKIMLAAIRDITERKRAEEERERLETQLRQAQKMEAIGHLTGGIAHDFNNILTSIIGYITFAMQQVEQGRNDKLNNYLAHIYQAGKRARDLIQQMLTFSRGQRGKPKPLTLAPLVKEAVKLLGSTLPSTMEFRSEFDTSLPVVMLDPIQVEQILMNLCINARDAMDGKGTITISLHSAGYENTLCSSCRQAVSGHFVELAVSDSGPGIAPEVVERMFEPFYTTKEVGKGSGMGLSTVHGIMHEHGGHILVETTPETGSLFRLLFIPLWPTRSPKDDITRKISGTTEPARRLCGHVLVVDDEPLVAEFMQDLLESWGLAVTVYGSSLDARDSFANDPQGFNLVVLDQIMPRLTGLELAQQILTLRPDMPIVLYTGYSEALTERQVKASGIRALVMKPVDVDEFFTLVSSLLHHDISKNSKS
jgi:PAS domain S-box-containing protein